jgi:hypothetical protein
MRLSTIFADRAEAASSLSPFISGDPGTFGD